MDFAESRCPRLRWHDYAVTLRNSEVQKEVCRGCGNRQYYYLLSDGRMKYPEAYRRTHVRDLCQPHGPTAHIFQELYGRKYAADKKFRAEQAGRAQRQADIDHEFDRYMAAGERTYTFL